MTSNVSDVVPYTTMCGFPYAHGTPAFGLTQSWMSTTLIQTYPATLYPSNSAMPGCALNNDSCTSLWSSYSKVQLAYWAQSFPNPPSPSPTPPACPTVTEPTTTTSTSSFFFNFTESTTSSTSSCNPKTAVFDWIGGGPCALFGGPVQLGYWPPEVTGPPCNRTIVSAAHNATNGTTVTAVVWGSATLTSPTAYLSFSTLYAVDACGNTMGSALSGYILPVQSKHISTDCGGWHDNGGPVGSLNFADLISPVPPHAYRCMAECQSTAPGFSAWQFCSTIYDDYKPQLAFPTEVWSVYPEWKSCGIPPLGNILYDPPIALTQVATEAGLTVPNAQPTTTPASPSSTPKALPQSTTNGVPDPTTPAAQSPSDGSGSTGTNPRPSSQDGPVPSPTAEPQESSDDRGTSQQDPITTTANAGGIIGSLLGGSTTEAVASQPDPEAGRSTSNLVDGSAGPTNVASPEASGNPADPGSSNSDPANVSPAVGPNVAATAEPGASTTGLAAYIASALGMSTATTANNGQAEAAGSQSIVVDGSTQVVPAGPGSAAPQAGVVFTAGGSTLTAQSANGGVVVDGNTIPSGQAATVNGVRLSNAATGVVIGSSTLGFSVVAGGGDVAAPTSAAVVNIGSQTYTAVRNSGIVSIGGQVLTPGQIATIDGTVVSDASTGLAVGSSTAAFAQTTPTSQGSSLVFSASGSTYTATQGSDDGIAIDGTLLSAGGHAITVNGQLISAAPSGLVVGSSTLAFSPAGETGQAAVTTNGAVFSEGGLAFTAYQGASGVALIDGTPLSPGQVATINGHTISDASSGLVVDGTRTIPFSQITISNDPTQHTTSGAVFSAGSNVLTALLGSSANAIVDGTTLTPGQVITIDGDTVSDASTAIVIDETKTMPFSRLTVTNTAALTASTDVGSATSGSGSPEAVTTNGVSRPMNDWMSITITLTLVALFVIV